MKNTSLLLIILTFFTFQLTAKVSTPKFFSDHMVLQRDMPINLWGTADKGEIITVRFNNKEYTTQADKKGNWSVVMDSMPFGGPYNMSISGKANSIDFKDILIGDVWICSGQSNMEWPLEDTENAADEIKRSMNPNIRLITVEKTIKTKEAADIESGTWEVCKPETSRRFSAVGYYFGKELQTELNIPVGLINTSWGGTDIQPWTSWETMVQTDDYKKYTGKTLDQSFKYDPKLLEKYNQAVANDKGLAEKWYAPDTKAKGWEKMYVPKLWDGILGEDDGIVWFRTTLELPESAAGKAGVINLGPVDDEDMTYINGSFLGETQTYNTPRNYAIKSGILKSGINTIVVRVKDNTGGGGMFGRPEEVYLEVGGTTYPLAGEWEYKPSAVTSQFGTKPLSPNVFASVLYNGMVKPLVGYNIKGAIWYQGENNSGEAYKYRTLFPNMINDWRKQWGYEFPFFWVQLANFMEVQSNPVESAWAELREAQNMTLSLPKTGQAVITDIGDADDIHPRNKKDVGHRLALNALKTAYGKDLIASGPVYDSMSKEGNKIILTFKNTGTGLSTIDGNKYGYVKGFSIAGADKKFVWAKAYIDENKVVVFSEKVANPAAVRYAWADNPDDNNLVNSAGLLSSPFRTDDWKGITER
ncbi:sialate O-acetylesterase [Parabacteroides sp. PF5-5]|uniref:sialate O-acetylesterase n=1 Tax=unclassified Parabacteroides TaxID=2649774 RepID=UPI0024740F5D|nr:MULTISPECIES: sialate O-acetylesterase [unclassified Parabacteroides]MDH6306925.1 sialate O-acetylesterase [Parabacteroides sp. PH5-39]MDH6317814.1 sialate O-acetylesterase [Parabacteroides sp. PF5-13]MDH6321530.1 sialate O-acetylesterase [Parabacteroides sp. PH5-13]MDH6325312.1 sialate O-acetylesterase [Parabacteroides sp. PH5-8]MDH6328983.1 sialate O-acetylesterase [Parabacteroides sp. PH5-41]